MRGSARLLPSRLPTGGRRKDSAAMPPVDTGYAASERQKRRERIQNITLRALVVLCCALGALAIYLVFRLPS